jgi:oxygen-dependent protoporphyrinogen oxidase
LSVTTPQQKASKRIAVIGGGITGLAAAHRLQERATQAGRPVNIVLFEARDTLGGSISTIRRDGFLLEGGPDSFITQKPWALQLAKRLGIDDQLIPTNPNYRRTFVVRDGRMHPVPEGFLLLAPTRILPFVTSRLFSWPGKLRMGLDLLLPRRDHGATGDESLSSFVTRRLGREALERVAQPLVSGIYTADPDNLSLRATMPRFLEMEDKYGSLILAMRANQKLASKAERGDSGARYSMFVSFRHGMTTLIDTLTRRLPEGTIHTNAPVSKIERSTGDYRLTIGAGRHEHVDAVLLASPAYAGARMIQDIDPALAGDLDAIDYANSATMSLAFRADQVPHSLDGFGFVVPAVERRSLIAVTFSSVKFEGRAPDGWVLMRAFLAGAMHPEVYEWDDRRLEQAVLQDLRDILQVQGRPRFTHISRWPRSMPQYPVGHLDHVARIHERLSRHPGLDVAGNAFGGVGIPDCVQSGEAAAERLFNDLVATPATV